MGRGLIAAIGLLMLCAAAPCGAAAGEEVAGVVKNAAGPATITRDGRSFPAAAGAKLRAGDVLATGPGGSMGVILRDDSVLSLGPDSSVAIRKFLFAPAEGKLGLLVRISRGTLACISGLIARIAPESIRFETPAATIGIRGTRFAVKAGGAASP